MDRQHRYPERLAISDACARFVGVALLVVVGYAHLLDISHKIDEGIWYMAVAFIALIGAAIVVSFLLVRAPAAAVRLVWVAAAALCAAALLGYVVSRMIPLPGMADHAGDWINAYGVIAALAELGLVGVAAFAMRDLTLRGVAHEAPGWIQVPKARGWPMMAIALAAVASLPDAPARGHGGEDDEAAADSAGSSPGAASGQSGGGEGAAPEPAGGGHGDPLLGSFELTGAMILCAGFLVWAARDLFSRARLAPPAS